MSTRQAAPFATLVLVVAAIFIIAWGIRSSASILNPILLALVITVTVLPLPQDLAKRGLPVWLSFILTLLAVVGVIVLVLLIVFFSAGQLTGAGETNVPSQPADSGGQPTDSGGQPAAAEVSWHLSARQISQLRQALIGALGQAVVLGFTVLLIFVFMLSAAITAPAANRLGLKSTSAPVQRAKALTKNVRRYMSIMTGVNLLVGIGDALFLMILGVEHAVLWGLLAWFMGYIPTVGFWIAMIPPILVAWTQNSPQTALFVLLGYVLINGSVQNFVQPRLMGTGLGITPVVVFISLFVWGWLLGGVGAILAVPLTMFIMNVLDSFQNTRWIANLMSIAPGQKKDQTHDEAGEKLGQLWGDVKNIFGGDNGSETA